MLRLANRKVFDKLPPYTESIATAPGRCLGREQGRKAVKGVFMKQFRADLHIHSRYSRATSRRLTPANLAAWAQVKGLHVLGSGDFTHSGWRKELKDALTFDEDTGLYRVRETKAVDAELPEYTGGEGKSPLFMLQAEISSIYKRGGAVRKVHNLVFVPDFAAADNLCKKLAVVGNLESDGRPILGLDSRDLLEMVLETAPNAFLVPAHIWTPWFALFGSKSGFNDITECFGDLSNEVFALETGLSSDPEMNRLWSALDRFKLISNSDAHSGENLGREANLFTGPATYDGMYRALKGLPTETVFDGTLEFYPEEGKYHLDGHRKCNVVLTPKETRELGGICPVCGKPLTVGVLYRVMELADRDEPVYPQGPQGPGGENGAGGKNFASLIPLPEILAEILGNGSKSKKVAALYAKVVAKFGSELEILQTVPVDDLARFMPPLGEGVDRMRKGLVTREGGYDGEYGVVTVFSEQERREFTKGALLTGFTPAAVGLTLDGKETEAPKRRRAKKREEGTGTAPADAAPAAPAPEAPRPEAFSPEPLPQDGPDVTAAPGAPGAPGGNAPAEAPLRKNEAQAKAVAAGPGPVLVIAGPGTGKTRTLVERVLHLLEKGVSARHILAVTFTRRAAGEMDERIAAALEGKTGKDAPMPRSDTLHALAFELWHKTHDEAPTLLSEEAARRVFAEANGDVSKARLREAWDAISLAREKREALDDDLAGMYARYSRQKGGWNLADYTDLLEFWLEQIQTGLYTTPWAEILVDEIQDLSHLQLTLLKAILPADGRGFFGIGDPDQSIYGFRGAHGEAQAFFKAAWPSIAVITLRENYRSAPAILNAASSLLGEKSACGKLVAAREEAPGAENAARMHLFEAPSADAEASWVAAQVRALVGGSSLTLRNQVREAGLALPEAGEYSPSDIAILVRMRSLAPLLQKALTRVGLLAAVPEDEGFWMDERVARIIREAGRMIGISGGQEEDRLPCSDAVITRGPAGIAAYFEGLEFFDPMFWQSTAFKALDRAYREYGGWQGLINWVHLQTELEQVKSKSERVQIMSLHAAKGLEFKAVFLPALEDGLLPFAGPGMLTGQVDRAAPPADIDEERRLFYVGLTRAKENLFLSHAAHRKLYGRELHLKPSRFLADLPLEGLSRSALVAKQKREEQQLKLL
ncbi:UvrD/REP helicase [uncultured delta proteobacterium]|uniref:UvrD/REP helicase n=1 Tax=uncultured delta proteobacterium TaxID=34034 RepID=A0A212JTJ5_9DELT|nr:UvrD/REP helicase [uncultured delta proteobacterium]